jgi:FAD/FMN-containing dehydrogenase
MVLIGDIVGNDADAVAQATSEVVRMANGKSGEGFVAVNAEARKRFWLDRSRTAAIAKHTNAFKINEDVVIPLNRMGEYTDGIERINIELSIKNKLQLLDALEVFFKAGKLPLGKSDDANEIPSAELLEDRVQNALELLKQEGPYALGIPARQARPVVARGAALHGSARLRRARGEVRGPRRCAAWRDGVRCDAGPHGAGVVEAGSSRRTAPDLQWRRIQADPRRGPGYP